MINIVANRRLLATLRRIAKKVPFFWIAYRCYWRLRMGREAMSDYPADRSFLDFGSFPPPTLTCPVTQLCTSAQMRESVYEVWCDAMHSPPRFSRKQWEFVYILQVLSLAGMLAADKTGLGFGCGREPLAGLFARHGCDVLATDLEAEIAHEQGWAATMQHASSIKTLYGCSKEYLPKKMFFDHVSFRAVDMNAIPDDLAGKFDFVWSACALEHLGSLRHGIDFVENSAGCLKPGGVAVHTTEFNLSSFDHTVESDCCSVYRACDIKKLIAELETLGYEVAPLNLNTGSSPVDRHVDLPPYGFSPHIKLNLEGYTVTSIGIVIRKPTQTGHRVA